MRFDPHPTSVWCLWRHDFNNHVRHRSANFGCPKGNFVKFGFYCATQSVTQAE